MDSPETLKTALPQLDYQRICMGLDLKQLADACRDWGFFELINHPLSKNICEDLLNQMKIFFSLPLSEKKTVERTSDNHWGFYDRELTKNARDWKQIFDTGHEHDFCIPQWPTQHPDFRIVTLAYYTECERIAIELIRSLGRTLDTNSSNLADNFKNHSSYLRLNYYPLCKNPASPQSPTIPSAGELGVGHHTDSGAITLLLQDGRQGLQIEHGGAWRTVSTGEASLVVNIGDVVQVWSNDRYKAPLHRVLASDQHVRYSAPFFLNPSFNTSYSPLPSVVGAGKAHYRPIKWGEFRKQRAAGDYANYGKEIQIDDFRISDP